MSRKRNCVTIAFVVCTYHTTFPGNNAGSGLLFICHPLCECRSYIYGSRILVSHEYRYRMANEIRDNNTNNLKNE